MAQLLTETRDPGIIKRKNSQRAYSVKRFAKYYKLIQSKNNLDNNKKHIEEINLLNLNIFQNHDGIDKHIQYSKYGKRANSVVELREEAEKQMETEAFAKDNNLHVNFEEEPEGQNYTNICDMIGSYGNKKFNLVTSTKKTLSRKHMEEFIKQNRHKSEVPQFIIENSPSYKHKSRPLELKDQFLSKKSNLFSTLDKEQRGSRTHRPCISMFKTMNQNTHEKPALTLENLNIIKHQNYFTPRGNLDAIKESKSTNISPKTRNQKLFLPVLSSPKNSPRAYCSTKYNPAKLNKNENNIPKFEIKTDNHIKSKYLRNKLPILKDTKITYSQDPSFFSVNESENKDWKIIIDPYRTKYQL